ncbi:uncharacterized protein EI90DRAFT_3287070 [Cantharellus anzutake]|uniref:uncharacterized protein n=1 Tax=Cantharellus anzutake TaxID=1750568 RepID=UPI001904E168|nr:uncharacterized protein EI90DRAFT_3287070 [Cantharellus anzutake]KAF8337465.1 hypothetical protein EI90DRAFT_3287070 [Cantharellus anzutake]
MALLSLGPKSGMITQSDIDVMFDIERRVGMCKNIGLYGGASLTAAYGRFYRKPPWSVWRTLGYSTLASMVGLGASSMIAVRVLFKGINRLENKDRFNAAIRAMKEDRFQNPKGGTGTQPEEGTRWANIRAARGTAKHSTWDAIRERSMKSNMPPPNSTSPGASKTNAPSLPSSMNRDSNTEVSEREKFDALLDAERNFGQDQDAWKESRWP